MTSLDLGIFLVDVLRVVIVVAIGVCAVCGGIAWWRDEEDLRRADAHAAARERLRAMHERRAR